MVARCLKLIKPYVRKEVVEAEDDDDNDDDDGGGANRKTVPTEGRIMERDFLSQAYGISTFWFALFLLAKILV